MKNTFIFSLGILAILLQMNAFAGFDFTYNNFGVQALGMGGGFIGCSEGPDGIFYNPASINAKSLSLKIETGAPYGTGYYALYGEYPISFYPATMKFAYLNSTIEDIMYTHLNELNIPIQDGYFSYGIQTAHGTLSAALGPITLGIGARAVFHTLATQNATHTEYETGILLPISLPANQNLTLGFRLRNALSNPIVWTTGYSESTYPLLSGGMYYRSQNRKFNISCDSELELRNDTATDFSTLLTNASYGMEYWFSNGATSESVAMRLGNNKGRYALGLGFRIGNLSADYVYIFSNKSEIDSDQRFAFGWLTDELIGTRRNIPLKDDRSRLYRKTVLEPLTDLLKFD